MENINILARFSSKRRNNTHARSTSTRAQRLVKYRNPSPMTQLFSYLSSVTNSQKVLKILQVFSGTACRRVCQITLSRHHDVCESSLGCTGLASKRTHCRACHVKLLKSHRHDNARCVIFLCQPHILYYDECYG